MGRYRCSEGKGDVYRGRVPSLTAEKAALLRGRVAAGEPKAKLARGDCDQFAKTAAHGTRCPRHDSGFKPTMRL